MPALRIQNCSICSAGVSPASARAVTDISTHFISKRELPMLKSTIATSLISAGLFLSMTSGAANAQTHMDMEMPATEGEQTVQFRRIDQPLGAKAAVTAGGLALIGLELWWFLGSKPKSQQAQTKQGIQEVTVTVDGGYEPSRVVVQAGQPVRLNFDRRDPSSCLEEVRLPDFHIAKGLTLNHVTPIEFTPEEAGEYSFTCGMNMFRGVIEVQPSEASQPTAARGARLNGSRQS